MIETPTMQVVKNKKYTYGFYDSIDEMPMYNWFRFYETDDLSYLLKEGFPCQLKKGQSDHLKKCFEKMMEQFIDVFGPSDRYKEILKLRLKIAIIEGNIAFNTGKFIKAHLDIAKLRLKNLLDKDQEETKPKNWMEMKVQVQKWGKTWLDEKKVCVREYYTMLAMIKKEADAAFMEQEKKKIKRHGR